MESTSPRRLLPAWSPRAGEVAGEWAELVREWFPQLADTRLRQMTRPVIEVHHDYINAKLGPG